MTRIERDRIPRFARDFPQDDALDDLVSAFVHGNYARVRNEAPKLARETEDDEVRRAARVLRDHVEADPLAKVLLALTLLILVLLAGFWIAHDGGGSTVAPPPGPRLIERVPP